MSSLFQNERELFNPALAASTRERRRLALSLLNAGVAAVDPARCTGAGIARLKGMGLAEGRHTHLFSLGKAALAMAQQALADLELQGGIVHCFRSGRLGPLLLERCGHPLPASEAAEQGQRVLQLARSLGPDDDALVLLSGGASAMLEAPVAGLSIADLQLTTRLLLACGADIGEVNAVRRVLSQTKGGGLLAALHPARVFNVILSDVPGQPASVVASGPSLPPGPGNARVVVERYGLADRLPPLVLQRILSGAGESWEQPADLRLHSVVAADNDSAVAAVVARGQELGVKVLVLGEGVFGEARTAGPQFLSRARALDSDAVIAGGECTVRLRGMGRGGRAQEFALAALLELQQGDGLVAAFGTDGLDGNSDAAGAIADAAVLDLCSMGAARGHLDDNDSASLFAGCGAQLITGRTGTNVSDLYLYVR